MARSRRLRRRFDDECDEPFEPLGRRVAFADEDAGRAEPIVVDGIEIGASFGGWQDELPDFSDPRAYASAEPVQRPGAYAGIIPGVDDRPERDRGNVVTAATLQREVKIQLRSSGGSKGRTRPRARGDFAGAAATTVTAEDFDPRLLGRMIVYGLTRGEREFFERRSGEARAVLLQLVALITIEQRIPEPMRAEQAGRPEPNFVVYGLDPEQVRILSSFRGSARAALVNYAHENGHAWIVGRDTLRESVRRQREGASAARAS